MMTDREFNDSLVTIAIGYAVYAIAKQLGLTETAEKLLVVLEKSEVPLLGQKVSR